MEDIEKIFGCISDASNIPVKKIENFNIDIDHSVKVNGKVISEQRRKIVASDIRSKIPYPYPTFRFKKGILLNGEVKINVTLDKDIDKIDTININGVEIKKQKFKNKYKNVNIICWKYPYEDMEFSLREGYRYLSIEEIYHIINLIYTDDTVHYILDCDIWS